MYFSLKDTIICWCKHKSIRTKNTCHKKKLPTYLFERSLCEQMTLNTRKSFVRIIISLFNQAQFFTLRLIQSALHTVCLLQSLKSQDQKLCVILVRKRWEGYGCESPAFQPMHSGSVYGNSLFSCNVRSILEIVVLPLLLSFQVKTC